MPGNESGRYASPIMPAAATLRTTSTPRPSVGDLVVTIDNRSVGRVARVMEREFGVTGHDGAFSLTTDAVFTAWHGTVTLICPREGLARYIVPGPGGQSSAGG